MRNKHYSVKSYNKQSYLILVNSNFPQLTWALNTFFTITFGKPTNGTSYKCFINAFLRTVINKILFAHPFCQNHISELLYKISNWKEYVYFKIYYLYFIEILLPHSLIPWSIFFRSIIYEKFSMWANEYSNIKFY